MREFCYFINLPIVDIWILYKNNTFHKHRLPSREMSNKVMDHLVCLLTFCSLFRKDKVIFLLFDCTA